MLNEIEVEGAMVKLRHKGLHNRKKCCLKGNATDWHEKFTAALKRNEKRREKRNKRKN